MSECESISGDEIQEASEYELSDSEENPPKLFTIPLHSCLRRGKPHLITEENYKTFIQTPESVLESVEEWGPSIAYVKDELINYELCKKAVENHSGAICSINPTLLSQEEYYNLCLQSVTKNGFNTKFVPKFIQDQRFVDAAIKSSCWALPHCVDKYKTYENCLSAVKRNGQTMESVPRHLITKEMCEFAAKSRYPCLNHIPKEFLTQEICEMAVGGNGENVKWVPDEFMSYDLAMLAITSPAPSNPSSDMAGSNIQYIKGQFLTKEIIVESVKRWWPTYSRIPKECLIKEVEDAILDVSPYCIKNMEQTPERCMRVIKDKHWLIEDAIKRENITKEMAEYILSLPKQNKKRFSKDLMKYVKSLL
jgi:hypothetical protein